MQSINHTRSTSCSIYGNKLIQYKNDHPSFNWNEIDYKIPNTNISKNDKSSIMKLFENKWFIQDSELNLSFDCSDHTGTLHGRVKEINIPELFKATETKQKQVKAALGSVRGVATQKFRDDYPYKDTIQVHMERYSTELSKRKNDFVDSVLLKNTSPLKRSRTEEVNEETNHKKFLCQYTEQTSLSPTLQDMSDWEYQLKCSNENQLDYTQRQFTFQPISSVEWCMGTGGGFGFQCCN